MSDIVIHICCAPCLGGPLATLREESFRPTGRFYNPNIHPLLEFRKRVKALRVFLESDDLPVEIDDAYGLSVFLETARPLEANRCARCYAMRMDDAARFAAEKGAPAFTTTMLASQHQDHGLVRRAGEIAAEAHGVAFLYRDFRPLAERSRDTAKRKCLYRQSYCGCVFSEAERYRDTTKELYRGPGGKLEHGRRR